MRLPRPWVNVQDGLSHGEERTYRAIFTHGKPYGTEGARALCAGIRQLAGLAGISDSNIPSILRTLAEKQAIEVHRAERHNDGKLLIAYPYGEILRRWRAAGLTHVLKLSRGVWLKSGPPETGVPVLESGTPDSGASDPKTGVPILRETGAPVAGAQIKNREEGARTSTTPSPGAPPLIAATLINSFGFIDDDALKTLIAKCRQNAPDATDEEIAELATWTARRIARMRNIDNPVGLLIEQTARCFRGEPFAIYRRDREERERRLIDQLSERDPENR